MDKMGMPSSIDQLRMLGRSKMERERQVEALCGLKCPPFYYLFFFPFFVSQISRNLVPCPLQLPYYAEGEQGEKETLTSKSFSSLHTPHLEVLTTSYNTA